MRMDLLQASIADKAGQGGCVVVALSGGVDSSLVALAAFRAVGERAIAVTGDHELVARRELDRAAELAALIGMAHRVLPVEPLDDPLVRGNGPDRCYGCKRALFRAIREALGADCLVLDGTNADDDPARPGLRAVREWGVVSPLKACGLCKSDVRALARESGLPTWDRPSESCLATRIPTGTPLEPGELALVDRLESFFHARGVESLRVRPDNLMATVEYMPEHSEIVDKLRDNFAAEIEGIGLRSCRFREWRE
ncbi:ATP-dependent sacrificial sulfur transferase LarE [Pseudodesulfovibrio sp.]|uniref:asparagine synthase-related protein n=1 Tax=Pseudodesulfovibrio sp. TaxID=2035812 RepID=UPI0026394F43|nr:ATP-dependent sacrificial sulfur transferase LarE [Pseudodesulfovibrio sp.]MDD3310521.1 ATP-dependent sacrificial sulfur transferase LarE [Pseudodesulfovibrio sp.]